VVLGTMIAYDFLSLHWRVQGDLGHDHGAYHAHDTDQSHDVGADTGDIDVGFDDIGDGGSIDV